MEINPYGPREDGAKAYVIYIALAGLMNNLLWLVPFV